MKKNPDINLLLVEDNPGDARLIQEMLKESTLAYHICSVAENLTLALSLVKYREFDIIILDLNLPESSGIDTLDRIFDSLGGIMPVIVLTGLDDESIGLSAIERGAEDYLVKGSINAAKLTRSIRYAIERKRSENALIESEKRYRTLFETMDEGFCVVEMLYDPDGKVVDYRFVEINPSFEKHTGLPLALGKTIRQMVPNHDEHWFEIYGKVARTGESIRFENPAVAMQRFFDVYAFRIGRDGSRKVGILFNDITERKRVEETLRRQLDELRRWQEVMMDREGRTIELKKEINGFLRELGRPEKYGE